MDLTELITKRDALKAELSGLLWTELRPLLYGLLLGRRNALTSPVSNLDGAIEISRVQAEIGILQLVMGLPDLVLADIQADIDAALQRDREEQEKENG